MSRIKVWEVLGTFVVCIVAAIAIRTTIGAINRASVSNDIDSAMAERHLLRLVEGRDGPSDDNEQRIARAVASLRTILLNDPAATVGTALGRAEALGNASPDALNAIAPSDRWALLAPLANADVRERLASLDRRHPLADIIRNGATPSDGVAIPAAVTIITRSQVVIWYLIGCLAFVIAFSVRALFDRKHPVMDAPWGRIPTLLVVAAASPATVPALILYGIGRVFAAEIPWRERWRAFAHGLRRFGYRTRLLRRLPSPVLAPVSTVAPAAIASSASPQDAAESGTRDEDDADGDGTDNEDDAEWYVIHPDEILGREHLLAAEGVPYYPITIGVPEELKAFAVEADRIGDFERVLDLDEAETEDEETDIERTYRRTYDGDIGEVALNRVPVERADMVKRVLETVSMNATGLNLAFTQAGGYGASATVSGHDWIEVFHFATPDATGRWQAVGSVHGCSRRDGSSISSLPPADGRGHVIKDESGNAIVQVIGRKVYLLCDLLSYDEPWVPSVLARAVYDGIRAAQGNPLDDEGDAAAWRGSLDAERDKYVALCLQRVDARRAAIEKEIADYDEEINDASRRITNAVRKRHGAVKALETFMKDEQAAETERLRKEFDQLAAAKPVLAVRAYADRVEVDTRTVYIEHVGRRYEIGRFRISIDDRGGLSIANISNTATGGGCDHPHVRDRRPCLGNISEPIAKLLGERDYALVVNMLFRFLESYSPPGRPYAHIEYWKEVAR